MIGGERLTGLYYGGRRQYACLKARLTGQVGHWPQRPFNREAVRSIVMVCTGLIGDTVMCMPTMAETRRLFPHARLVGLVHEQNHGLLEPSGWFDEFIVAEGSPFPIRPTKRKAVAALKQRLAQARFDLSLILLGDDWAETLWQVGIPWRVGVQENVLAPFSTHGYSIGSPCSWGPAQRLNALRVLGFSPSNEWPAFKGAPSARASLQRILRAQQVSGERPLLVLHPFGSSPHTWYPMEQMTQLVSLIQEHQLGQVVVIGGSREDAVVRNTPALTTQPIINLVGKLKLPELVALLEQAALVVSTDSGPYHLAGILGRPTVGLFRTRRPEHARHYASAHVILGQEPGAACAMRCQWDTCEEWPCRQLAAIAPQDIVHRSARLLMAPVR